MEDTEIIQILLKTVKKVIHKQGQPHAKDREIDRLLNTIAAELGLTIRFKSMNSDEDPLIRVDVGELQKEASLYPELVARFSEQYHHIQKT